jgi:hypothetical protein
MNSSRTLSRRHVLALVVGALTLGACASAGRGGDDETRGTQNHIVRAELANLDQLSAYQAIQRLRPRWLRTRLGRAPVPIIDGAPRRDLRDLQTIRATEVEEMRFMSAADATTRYGTGYDGGAILVTTLKG